MSVHVQIFGEVVFLSPGSEENWGFFQFGTTGDVPLPGDFDGDRRADYAFFRPSNATWYIQQSTLGYRTALFGLANDKLVPLDYDGDGTTDFGVFRPSTGLWFTAPSAESNPGQHYTSFLFGQNGDIPSPGDYDWRWKI